MVATKKDAVPQISLALTGYSTDNAEEFIQKAFVVDKGQKQIIKKLYQDRDEIAANCSPELALQAVQTQSFLACLEGRKLAAYFLIEILECELFWNTVKTQIQTGKANKVMCQYWGAVILYAWKAAEMNPVEDDAIRKKDVEALIVQDLFYCSVFLPKTYSHKFNWVLDGFLSEDEPTKRFNHMLFRSLLPLIWRNLDAPNENVRTAVSHMLLKFYPLRADDEFVDADYMQKQNDAMLRMLMDDCLPIRVEAAKKIPFHLGLHWKDFPRNLIKNYLDTIVDKLSLDNAAEVRAAAYEGMEGLLKCGPALNATQHALGILAKRGINDKTEKVRLAAFRLLNKLKGHRFIKYFDLVDMDDLLMRLDFEHSNSVQQEIVLLIFKSFSPKTIEGIDFAERYKRIRFMCKKSRNASLHFHRWIYRLKLVTVEQAVRHIRSMIIGVKANIKNLLKDGALPDQTNDDIGDEMTLESLDLTGMTSLFGEQGAVGPVEDEKLMVIKHVLDSAIVLWIAIRPVLYDKYANENQQVIQIMANILQALDPYSNTVLADSALTIATYLPKEKVGRMYGKLLKIVEKGEIDDLYFAHYVEALANWDMNMLLEIVKNGLKKLRNFVARTSGLPVMSTPMRTPALASPARKRSRMIDSDPNELSRPLKLIKTLLASPTTAAHLKQQFGVHLKAFHKALLDIRTAFGELLKSDDWKNVDLKLMLSAYETLTVISLIMTPEELEIDIESDDEDAEHIVDAKTGLLFIEVRWFESIMYERFPPNQVVQVFLRSSNLHLECGKLSICVLSRLSRILIKLASNAEENPGLDSLKEPIKKAVKRLCTALEFCEEEQEANALIEDKLKPLLTDRNEQDDSDDDL